MLARLRDRLRRMSGRWQPRPEHRAQVARVERIEARAEKLGVTRKDELQMRLEVIQRGREWHQQR